jgi:hypothetical protein
MLSQLGIALTLVEIKVSPSAGRLVQVTLIQSPSAAHPRPVISQL